MASLRCRLMSRPAINLVKSTITKPTFPSLSTHSCNQTLFSRSPLPQIRALESLLALHSAVSSARLTSCLGSNANGCWSFQDMHCCANPGV